MIWTKAELSRVGGALSGELRNARLRVHAREGLWLRLSDGEGHTGIGECAPLPGYSRETLEECRLALSRWIAVRDEQLPPAARCAVETALLDLRGHVVGKPVHALLASGAAQPVPLSAVVNSVPEAEAAVAAGFRTLKVKIGLGPFEAELDLLRAIRGAVGPEIQLRLDANGALPVDGLRERLTALSELSPEFLEEPTTTWTEALADSPLPLAVDESLQGGIDPAAFALASVAVLKPMLLGGPKVCLFVAERFADAGKDLVVSHTWDGPVGLATACATALAIGARWPGRLRACGLAPHEGLAAWPDRPLPFLQGETLLPSTLPGLGLPCLPEGS